MEGKTIVRRNNNPCYKCEDRKVGCHSTCEKYISWKDTHEKAKNEIDMIKQKNQKDIDYILKSVKRMSRGRIK